MYKENNGYFLLDSVYGFLIIVLLCTGLVPLFTHIYRERQVINSENHAIDLLKEQSVLYRTNGTIEEVHFKESGIDYHSYLLDENQKKELCIEWINHTNHLTTKCLDVY